MYGHNNNVNTMHGQVLIKENDLKIISMALSRDVTWSLKQVVTPLLYRHKCGMHAV